MEGKNIGEKTSLKIDNQEEVDEYAEYAGLAAYWENIKPKIPESEKREAGPEIQEFEDAVADFEANYSLEELHNIINLTTIDAPTHPIREPARLALIPIVAMLNALEQETNITKEELAEVKTKYKRLSQAVGMLSNGIIDHTRG